MKSISFWIKFISQLAKRYWFISVISIAFGVVIFLSLTNLVPIISTFLPKTKRIGVVGKYTLNNLPKEVSNLVSHGLTEILANDRATGSAIIASWTINPEGNEYDFYLKPEVYWQDGKKIKPSEIKYKINGANISYFDNGVKISLDSPFSPILSYLSKPIFKEGNIGLGPYRIKKTKLSSGTFSSILLTAVDNSKNRILFKFYPNESSLITAFNIGEIDEALGISNIESLLKWKNISIKAESVAKTKYVALFFNTRKEDLSLKRIRQGLTYAIEKPQKTERATSPLSPSSWAYNEKVKGYEFDPKHAIEILKNEKENYQEELKIKIQTLPELLSWAEKIKENWEKNLKIKVELQVTNFVPAVDQFDAFLGYGLILPDPDQYFFWHSTQQGNLTGINNPRIDQLLEKGRKTIDPEERKNIYQEFQQALSEEVPAVFLFYPPSYTVTKAM